MNIFSSIPGSLYSSIYLYLLVGLCLVTSLRYLSTEDKLVQNQSGGVGLVFSLILSIFVIIFLGTRPITGQFGDTGMYAYWYDIFYSTYELDLSGEWIWEYIAIISIRMGLDASGWFLLIEFFYIGLMLASCWLLMRRNVWVALLFCLVSFSCFSYGVNGIRNGLACNIVMLAVALISGNSIKKIIAVLLMITAYFIHHSTALPSVCAISAWLVIKDPKYAISFWGASILLSLVIGNAVGDFFTGFGFDERESYFVDAAEISDTVQFSSTGFRFDFLLYSAMPVLMAWYVAVKRNFQDKTYNIIANTYILANAFWILVIRATFSNRFAYLSWFLYPIVIAYPLLRMNIWEDQDRKAALILLAYAGFTFAMHFIS